MKKPPRRYPPDTFLGAYQRNIEEWRANHRRTHDHYFPGCSWCRMVYLDEHRHRVGTTWKMLFQRAKGGSLLAEVNKRTCKFIELSGSDKRMGLPYTTWRRIQGALAVYFLNHRFPVYLTREGVEAILLFGYLPGEGVPRGRSLVLVVPRSWEESRGEF